MSSFVGFSRCEKMSFFGVVFARNQKRAGVTQLVDLDRNPEEVV